MLLYLLLKLIELHPSRHSHQLRTPSLPRMKSLHCLLTELFQFFRNLDIQLRQRWLHAVLAQAEAGLTGSETVSRSGIWRWGRLGAED